MNFCYFFFYYFDYLYCLRQHVLAVELKLNFHLKTSLKRWNHLFLIFFNRFLFYKSNKYFNQYTFRFTLIVDYSRHDDNVLNILTSWTFVNCMNNNTITGVKKLIKEWILLSKNKEKKLELKVRLSCRLDYYETSSAVDGLNMTGKEVRVWLGATNK